MAALRIERDGPLLRIALARPERRNAFDAPLIRERPTADAAARLAAGLRTSPEGQEGLRAFLDKRPAAWRSESSS